MAIDDPTIVGASWQEPLLQMPRVLAFPVDVRYEAPPKRMRLWAIPVFGYVAKAVILIPHALCLGFLLWFVGVGLPGPEAVFLTSFVRTFIDGNFVNPQIAAFAVPEAIGAFISAGLLYGGVQLVLWLWVLIGGRYPTWGYALVGGTLRWFIRVSAFSYGLTDHYPPFSFKGVPGRPVDTFLELAIPPRSVRWWAVPVLGFWAKELVLIPHFIALGVLTAVAAVVGGLIVPSFVLFSGRYPGWAVPLVGGAIRYFARVYAFLFGLTDRYPPFSLR